MTEAGPYRPRDVEPLLRPRTVAVIGASATKRSQGNSVIGSLRLGGYSGRIVPVHPSASELDDLPAVASIDRLPPDTDTAVVAIPAASVAVALGELEAAGVRSAVVFSNGFSAAQQAEVRTLAAASPMVIHGPNCMGLINFTDALRLYPSTVTDKVAPGCVAIVAQSGSAAISLMNSTAAGLSKVVTLGNEWQVTAPDYLRWLASDPATSVVGMVIESIKDPAAFSAAAALVRAAGKALVVLKVGRSAGGAEAVRAHTGALIGLADAYDSFFATAGIPTAGDYDELIASMECFAACRGPARGGRIGVVGISGGETALACDVVTDAGLTLARWGEAAEAAVRSALPGASGANPLDLGATPNHDVDQDDAAIRAIVADPGVDQVLVVQDSQATLTPTMRGNYTPRILAYGRLGAEAEKPFVMVSPTGENTHPEIVASMAAQGVPVLRGLRPAAVALRNLMTLATAAPGIGAAAAGRDVRFEAEIARHQGPLPADLTARILDAFGIPAVRSALVTTDDEVVAASARIGFPLVAKIASPDVPHRSDVGGVTLGIADVEALRTAMTRMRASVLAARPDARIEGFELQEELVDCVEAAAGFVAAPPFAPLVMVSTGGVLVELEADRAVHLAPFTAERARKMIDRTRLGRRLRGYRGLMPPTDVSGLAELLARLSALAAGLPDIAECDLNPVLIRKGSGEPRVVDALMLARPA